MRQLFFSGQSFFFSCSYSCFPWTAAEKQLPHPKRRLQRQRTTESDSTGKSDIGLTNSYFSSQKDTDPEVKICGTKRCVTCPHLKQGKESTFSDTNETFRIKHSMNCTSTDLIYVITCAGCGHNYIGETGDVLRNRVTVHKQQIRDLHTCMLGITKHIDECAAGLTPQFTIFPFYKILMKLR